MADFPEALKHRMTNALLDNQYEEDEIERKANMYDFYRKEYVDVLLEVLAQPPTDQPAAGVEPIPVSAMHRAASAVLDEYTHSVPCAAQETPKGDVNEIVDRLEITLKAVAAHSTQPMMAADAHERLQELSALRSTESVAKAIEWEQVDDPGYPRTQVDSFQPIYCQRHSDGKWFRYFLPSIPILSTHPADSNKGEV